MGHGHVPSVGNVSRIARAGTFAPRDAGFSRRVASSETFVTRRSRPRPSSLIAEIAMAVKMIQLGQVWRNDQSGRNYLVTKLYNEVFTQYALLRQADSGATTNDCIKVKVQKSSDGSALPGYTFTQEGAF